MTNPLRRRCLLWLATLPVAARAQAQAQAQPAAPPAEVLAAVPGARLQGSGTLRYFGFRVYDARLWSVARVGDDWTAAPLALELEYLRNLDGAQIAERSLVEMRRQAEISAADAERWLAGMKKLFPDVRAGDRLTGVLLAGGSPSGSGARFFLNGSLRGELREAEFAKLFFGIWLSPRSSEPALRSALLGTAAGAGR